MKLLVKNDITFFLIINMISIYSLNGIFSVILRGNLELARNKNFVSKNKVITPSFPTFPKQNGQHNINAPLKLGQQMSAIYQPHKNLSTEEMYYMRQNAFKKNN